MTDMVAFESLDPVRDRKCFTRALLIAANNEAIKAGRNRTLKVDKVAALPDMLFPVSEAFLHNDVEIRCRVVFDEMGRAAYLDIPLDLYTALPTA